jgi:large repetitive protein
MPISASGLSPRKDADGGFSFTNTNGQVVSRVLPARAWDAQVDAQGDPVNVAPVSLHLVQSSVGSTLVVTPDPAWLSDPRRVFPVTIDPTYAAVNVYPSFDTYVQTGVTSDQSAGTELRVGTLNSGTTVARSFLNFPEAAFKGKKIISAALKLYETGSASCTATGVTLKQSTSLASTTTTWSNQPGVGATSWAASFAKGFNSSCAAGWVSIPMTTLASTWSTDANATGGLRLSATNEADNLGWKAFASTETTNDPYVTATYDRAPAPPSIPAIVSGATWSGSTYASTTSPQFSAVASDPDGNQVSYSLQAYTSSAGGTPIASCTTAVVSSATSASCTLTPALTNGSTYYVRARATDDQSISSPWSSLTVGSAKFIVAASAPPSPIVSCPAPYTNGSWQSVAPATPLTCSVTVGGSGANAVVQASVSVDGSSAGWVTASPVTPLSVTVSNANGGHSITAQARTASGLTATAATYGFGYGQAGLTAPTSGAKSNDVFLVSGSTPPAASGTVTAALYWRRSGGSEPADFSTTNGSITGWTVSPTSVPVSASAAGATVSNVAWHAGTDLAATGLGRLIALVDTQICFTYVASGLRKCTWIGSVSSHLSVLHIPHAFGGPYPTADAGPGQVALWTGEFSLLATDVSGNLTIARTSTTFDAPTDAVHAVFGPGWSASWVGPAEGAAGMTVSDSTSTDGTISLIDGTAQTYTFREPGGGRILDASGDYVAVDANTQSSGGRLSVSSSGVAPNRTWTITHTAMAGSVTTFARSESGPNVAWAPSGTSEPGTAGQTAFSRDSNGRITRILAPTESGVTCPATGPLNPGCQALTIAYATTTTATATANGDFVGQVSRIDFTAFNPNKVGGAGMDVVAVSTYSYDASGRLMTASDPRTGLVTQYTYTGAIGSQTDPVRLATVRPPGEAKWYLDYDTTNIPGGGLGLRDVRRDPPDGSAGTPVRVATFVYSLPVSGAGLPNMANAVSGWGQGSNPTYAAAVFPASHTPSSPSPGVILSSEWLYAKLYYTDDQGNTLNTGEFGAGNWQTTSTTYDGQQNVVRYLDEAGLAAAKADPVHADSYATISRYNTDVLGTGGTVLIPAGTRIVDKWGPARQANLQDWTTSLVRPHTHTDYDQGAPGGGVNPATGMPYDLVTMVTVGVSDSQTATSNPSAVISADLQTSSRIITGYAAPVAGDPDTWALGLPTTSTLDADASGTVTSPDLTRVTRYNSSGRVVEVRQPASNGTDAGTKRVIYYRAGSGSGDALCDTTPQWAGLVCRTYLASAPNSGPALPEARTTAYSMYLAPTSEVETSGSATRTKTTSYSVDGKVTANSVSTVGVTGSSAAPTVTTTYDPASGLPIRESTDSTTYTQFGYDAWARVTSYRNSLGEITNVAYVPSGVNGAGAVATVTDAQGVRTFGYGTDANGAIEQRGAATSLTISGLGISTQTMSGSYDALGHLVYERLPGGLSMSTSYDVAGEPIARSYAGDVTDVGTGVTSSGSWLAWSQTNDVLGRKRREWTPQGAAYTDPLQNAQAFDRGYAYDPLGRLTLVTDRTSSDGSVALDPSNPDSLTAACTSRTYAFDKDGNRTIDAVYSANPDGTCQITTGAVARFFGYDSADRSAVAGGYAYDPLGRTTVIPASQTPKPSSGNLSMTYDDADAATSIAQGGVTTSYSMDPIGRRLIATSAPTGGGTATSTLVRHYSDSTDNPAWVSDSTTGVTTRYLNGLDGSLSLQTVNWLGVTNVQVSISNLHGDSVATAYVPTTGNASSIDAWSDYTEYGAPRNPSNANRISSQAQYGWLGASERSTDQSGIMLMGSRLYNPGVGRFTTPDALEGAGENAYNYPNDPVNVADTSGNFSIGIYTAYVRQWDYRIAWGLYSHLRVWLVVVLFYFSTSETQWLAGRSASRLGYVLAALGVAAVFWGRQYGFPFAVAVAIYTGLVYYATWEAVPRHLRIGLRVYFGFAHIWATILGHTISGTSRSVGSIVWYNFFLW